MRCCECCGQELPITCPIKGCEAKTHHAKSKRSASGVTYQVRVCDLGHKFVAAPDGRTARRWSSAMEHDGFPQGQLHKVPQRPRLTHSADQRA